VDRPLAGRQEHRIRFAPEVVYTRTLEGAGCLYPTPRGLLPWRGVLLRSRAKGQGPSYGVFASPKPVPMISSGGNRYLGPFGALLGTSVITTTVILFQVAPQDSICCDQSGGPNRPPICDMPRPRPGIRCAAVASKPRTLIPSKYSLHHID